MTSISHNAPTTFEETWPKAPFADLIGLSLWLADSLVKLRARPRDASSAATGRGQYA